MALSADASAPAAESPIAAALIDWHARHGRHDLPWQREPTPYRVWVSEVMLQQTQVATVIGYYERFMQRFPDVQALAAAPLDEVLHLWSGLGYYSRARNLQRAARQIVGEHGGVFPDDPALLARLPGIGRSTAAAIVALACGRRAAILDGNVRRVLSRYFCVDGNPADPATQRRLWQLAEDCTPTQQVEVYTQAVMDLGATLCTRRRPLCPVCPLSGGCAGYRSGRPEDYPAARPHAVRPRRQVVMLLAERGDGSVLLRRRPPQGVWGGLWAPPEFDSLEAAAAFCATSLAGAAVDAVPLPPIRHVFTHFELTITPVRARCSGAIGAPGVADAGGAGAGGTVGAAPDGAPAGSVVEGEGVLWYNPREPARVGLPAPIAALLDALPAV
jgi:A/G-specific adenine glycosylase